MYNIRITLSADQTMTKVANFAQAVQAMMPIFSVREMPSGESKMREL